MDSVHRVELVPPSRRTARLQVALGSLWLLDGLLQLQPSNRGSSFVAAIVGNAMGQPPWMQRLLVVAADAVGRAPSALSLTLAAGELALGGAIIARRTRRVALLVSVPLAVAIWVVGDALGSIPGGFAMLPSGAPGAALLYALAALVLVPRRSGGEGVLGERGAAFVWAALWGGGAVLQLVPVISYGFKLSAGSQMASLGEPAGLASLDRAVGAFLGAHGLLASIVLASLELLVGAAALLDGSPRRALLWVGFGLCAVFWVLGENLAGLAAGAATDPGAMPLYVLLGVTLLPASAPASPRRAGGACRRRSG